MSWIFDWSAIKLQRWWNWEIDNWIFYLYFVNFFWSSWKPHGKPYRNLTRRRFLLRKLSLSVACLVALHCHQLTKYSVRKCYESAIQKCSETPVYGTEDNNIKLLLKHGGARECQKIQTPFTMLIKKLLQTNLKVAGKLKNKSFW